MNTKNENKKYENENKKQPDPQVAEAQVYARIEIARSKIYGFTNQILKETGLPTALILEVLRSVIAETTLTLERVAHAQALEKLAEKLAEKNSEE